MSKTCKCGCGGKLTNDRWEYIRGHKPKETQNAELALSGPAEETAPEYFELTLTLSVQQIDALLLRLSPMAKANALTAALQEATESPA